MEGISDVMASILSNRDGRARSEPIAERSHLSANRPGGPDNESYEVIVTVRRVGPTTASKILHVGNPTLFVMWDDAIRIEYSRLLGRKLSTGADYVAFLRYMRALGESVVGDLSLRQ